MAVACFSWTGGGASLGVTDMLEIMMMRSVLVSAPFVVGLVAVAQPGSFPEPIKPAEAGKLQCHAPDRAAKTCQSLASYRALGDGVFENMAHVGLPTVPVTVMDVVSRVTIQNGQVCGRIEQADLETARFTRNGVELSAAMTAEYRKRVAMLYSSTMGHELCTAYEVDGEELITHPSIDGVAAPEMSRRVIWVSPEDGSRVGG